MRPAWSKVRKSPWLWVILGMVGYIIVEALARGQIVLPTILDLLKLLFSWPGLLLVFVLLFKPELQQLLLSVQTLRCGQFEMQRQPPSKADVPPRAGPAAEAAHPCTGASPSEETPTPAGGMAGETPPSADVSLDASVRAAYWEFRYWELFLVPITKITLFKIFHRGRVPVSEIFNIVPPTTPEQKLVIIQVLTESGFIAQEGADVVVTEKGRRFLKFIGLVVTPSPPPGNPSRS